MHLADCLLRSGLFVFICRNTPSKCLVFLGMTKGVLFMTKEDRNQIGALRRSGYTYAEISAVLGISVNTIKSYCRRNQLTEVSGPVCKNCGKPITIRPKCKPRQFCTDTCRIMWWRKHSTPKKTVYHLVCAFCGSNFECVGNRQQKYCSHMCYVSARFGKEGVSCG